MVDTEFWRPEHVTIATFVDEDLLAYHELWAAAGTPRHVFPIAPPDLVRVTSGRVAPLRVPDR